MTPTTDTTLTPDLDLFAGPGGWDTGIAPLGVRPLGVEWDAHAVTTARAAGHHRLDPGPTANVATLKPQEVASSLPGPVRGLIASPPCQGFTMAGQGKGRTDSLLLIQHLGQVRSLEDLEDAMAYLHAHMTDDRSLLVLEPLRWALALRPQWVAWEQVPAVQPIWDACAVILRAHGYTVDTGRLQAEQYGVPQTRRRAILVARDDHLSTLAGPARLPTATHTRYVKGKPRQTDGLLPWVSMADALRAADLTPAGLAIRSNYGTGGDPRNRGQRTVDEPAATVTSKVDRNLWIRMGNHVGSTVRPIDAPAPTVMFSERANAVTWHGEKPPTRQDLETAGLGAAPTSLRWEPTPAVPGDTSWVENRPSPTIVGSFAPDVVAAPGYRRAGDGPRQSQPGSVRVTIQEAGVLQSFPADYPWSGSRSAQYRQAGDAVPPLLARAIVEAVASPTLAG